MSFVPTCRRFSFLALVLTGCPVNTEVAAGTWIGTSPAPGKVTAISWSESFNDPTEGNSTRTLFQNRVMIHLFYPSTVVVENRHVEPSIYTTPEHGYVQAHIETT